MYIVDRGVISRDDDMLQWQIERVLTHHSQQSARFRVKPLCENWRFFSSGHSVVKQAISPLSPILPDRKTPVVGWGQLYGASQKLAITSAATTFNGLTLVLVPDSQAASQIEEGLRFPGFAFINVQSPCVTYGRPEQSLKAHKAIGCRGVSRSDFRLDDRVNGLNELVWLEVNTQPGMTPTSLSPEQAQACGMRFGELCRWMVEDASCNR